MSLAEHTPCFLLIDDPCKACSEYFRKRKGNPYTDSTLIMGKKQCGRKDDDQITEKRNAQRWHSGTEPFQSTTADNRNAGKNKSKTDDPQSLCSDGNRFRCGCKNLHEHSRSNPAEQKSGKHDSGSQCKCRIKYVTDSFVFSGTVIIADQWTDSLNNAIGRKIDKSLQFEICTQCDNISICKRR